jgi:DNA-binding MarR family transcriptional regulator
MPRTRDISSDEYRGLAELRFLIRSFLAFSETAAREAGVEPQQHQLLLVLKGLRPPERPIIRTVAERLLIHHNSAVELVRRSAERGLVERLAGEHDRREVSLRITARGERVLRHLTLAHRREFESAAPKLLSALDALLDGGGRGGLRNGAATRRPTPRNRTHTEQ